MRTAFFSAKKFEIETFSLVNNKQGHEILYFESVLTPQTASLAQGYDCICAFVNDDLSAEVLHTLKAGGTNLIALRSAGFNHVDIETANKIGLKVVRVPEYSPYAIAEHVVALIQTLNRKTHRAYNRVREGNFSLDRLVGFDLNKKKVGIIGVGKIGKILAKIMTGFGCEVLLFDNRKDESFALKYKCRFTSVSEIFEKSDIISLHIPLTKDTVHFIDYKELEKMKRGVMLINTGRGGLINTKALIDALKSGHIGSAGLDVYEEEEGVFFSDFSDKILNDDMLVRLISFPNVLITGHQAFLTREALTGIAETTLKNISDFESGRPLVNEIRLN